MTGVRDDRFSSPGRERSERGIGEARPAHGIRCGPWPWVIAVVLVAAMLVVHVLAARYTSADRLARQLTAALDGAYVAEMDATSYSLLRRSFTATGVRLTGDTAVLAERRWAGSTTRTVYSLSVKSVRLDGIDLGSFLQGRLLARSATIESLDLDAYLDRKLPAGKLAKPARLPHQWLQRLGKRIRIDTLRLVTAAIRYAERAVDGARPGTILFDQLSASAYNVTNDFTRAAIPTPSPIQVRGRVAGAPFEADLTYDLASPGLNLSYRGSVSNLVGQRLNATLANLEGIRIRDGRLDSAWFDVRVKDDLATGKLQLLYDDLESETLDKVTHERGLKDKIKTFIANKLTINEDNRYGDDEPPMVVTLRRQRPPEMTLFEFIWKTLRDGVFATVMD